MAFRGVRALALASVLTAPLFLAACGGSDDSSPTEAPTSSSASPSSSESPSPSVSLDEEVLEEQNAGPGEAVIPGSIESVEQELSPECEAGVAPLRAAMEKYPAQRSVPQAELEQLINIDVKAAKEACGGETGQEWTDFYTLEYSGWLFAKVD